MKLKSLIDVSKNKKLQPMSKEEVETFFRVKMLEMRNPNFSEPYSEDWPFALKILDSRLEWAGIADKVSFSVKLFLCSLCDRPALVVMWAYTLAHMLELNGGKCITIETLTEHFPFGFPTQELYNICWDSQKGIAHDVKADNLIDILEWWKP